MIVVFCFTAAMAFLATNNLWAATICAVCGLIILAIEHLNNAHERDDQQ